ncbi:sulfotransferase domain-containing protein [Roseovarius sp. D22-M7]|uniref:sulfotransferase domain-containing protein n=1 Tax=Roseovarius sp. D22-M7 TaxID=3127116 RepID=UPI00300FA05E
MTDTLRLLAAALPEARKTAWRKISRRILKFRLGLAGSDQDTRIRAERRLRGYQDYSRLVRADAVVVSFGKSGRTWLRVMISRLYQQVYGLPRDIVIGFDNFHNLDRRIPRVFFAHDNYIGDYLGNTDTKDHFRDKKVLLMVRDPRDVAVSQFFQWQFRMRPGNKLLNGYPRHGAEVSAFEFVCHEGGGLPKIMRFMNLWAREMHKLPDFELLRYEDMRADPHAVLARVARFLEIPASDEQIREAVEYAAYENMKKMEANEGFRMAGLRMAPGDRSNPDSFKVRRAKVGGYRDYFDDDEVRQIDAMMAETLDPVFGYQPTAPAETAPE